MRGHVLLLAFIASGTACSNTGLKRTPFLTASKFVEESGKAGGNPGEEDPPVVEQPMPTETKTPEESVNPPANISGTYLICAEMKAATTASPESSVHCGLRDQQTNNKVNLDAGYGAKLWSYETTGSGSLVVSMVELPQSLEWHIAVTLQAPTLSEHQAQQSSLRFFVSVTNASGLKLQESAKVSGAFISWSPSNGARIPANAAIGGTEEQGRDALYLCRVHHQGEIIPGKLIRHLRDFTKSQCLATYNNDRLQSQSDDGQSNLRPSDVLVVTQGVFDDYLEWVPANNGLKPANALITGKDALGNPLYSCRALQFDVGADEQKPGVLRPGASSCHYDYLGFRSNSTYQVLAWKGTATQKILDFRKVSAP